MGHLRTGALQGIDHPISRGHIEGEQLIHFIPAKLAPYIMIRGFDYSSDLLSTVDALRRSNLRYGVV